MTLFAAYRSTVLKSSLERSGWRFFTCLVVLVVFLGGFVLLGREAQAKQLSKAVSGASGAGLGAAGVAAAPKSATLSEASVVSAEAPVTGAGSASAVVAGSSKTAGGYAESSGRSAADSGSSAAAAVEGGSRPVKAATNGASTAESNPVPRTSELEQQLPVVSGIADPLEEVAPSMPEPLSVMDNPIFEPVNETAGPVLEPVGRISNPLLEPVGETVNPVLQQLDMKASTVLEPLGGVVSLPLHPEVKVAGPVFAQDIPAYVSGTGPEVLRGFGPASIYLKSSKSAGSVTAGQIMADVYAAGADAMKLSLAQLERSFSTEITPGSDVIEINETPGYVPLPALPGAPAGGAFTGSISAGELIPLLGILFLFVILLQVNKSRWAAYEYLRPNSVLHLVSERPG